MTINPQLVLIKPNKIFPKYLSYLMESSFIKDQVELIVGGGTMPTITQEDLLAMNVVIPSKNEQERISKFLDIKCGEINILLKSKERLIQLLEQKRQAMITEAVTKGLNPNVKMKDSGVEWIGEIPEHWNIKKVGYLGRLQNGISKSAEEFGFGSPFISYSDVYKNMVLPIKASGLVNSTTGEQQLYSVKKGDVFFTRTSETIEEIGFSATCLETIPNATFAGFLIRFRPNSSQLSPNYAKYYFRSDLRKHYFVKEMNLVTRASLGQGLLRNFPVVLPNTNEQEEIAEFLDSQTQAINLSVSLIQKQVQKLKEYRQSLIYEAVTGKSDVRDFEVEQ
jgi:type I restriction enzyme S subunit